MFQSDISPLGILFLTSGSVLILLIFMYIRACNYLRTRTLSSTMDRDGQTTQNTNAYLIVQSGGRIAYLSPLAREWLNIKDEHANLEYTSRLMRPRDALLTLCANQGQVSLYLDDRIILASSYPLYNGLSEGMFVTLHPISTTKSASPILSAPDQIASPYQDYSLSIQPVNLLELITTRRLKQDLPAILNLILDNLERLIPADFHIISLWDKFDKQPIYFRLFGLPGTNRQIEQIDSIIAEDYSRKLIDRRQPLLIPEVKSQGKKRAKSDNGNSIVYRSYLGAPLLVADELIGTLELVSTSSQIFNQNDLALLKSFSTEAAIIIDLAQLNQERQDRFKELSSLAILAQEINTLQDSQDLYSKLVEIISSSLDVEIFGFLIYDNDRHTLTGQVPFWGLPENFLSLYHTDIPNGSQAEKIFLSHEIINSINAPEDERLLAMGLAYAAKAAEIKNTLLVPLIANGHSLGYLQFANKRDSTPFNQDGERQAIIIASQIAPLIENAALTLQANRRTQRNEALRRIASLVSSTATLDEILQWSLRELARLIQAEKAAIYLLNDDGRGLYLQIKSSMGVPTEVARRLSQLKVEDTEYTMTVCGSQKPFRSSNVYEDDRILPLYRSVIDLIDVKSVMDVPLVIRDRGVGEIMLGSSSINFFNHNDLNTAIAIAGQIAGAIDRSYISSQTDENLRKRVEQLTTITRISRELNSTLDLDRLLHRVYTEVIHTTRADSGTILLVEPTNEKSVQRLAYHVGEPPNQDFHILEQIVLNNGEPLIIEDYSQFLPTKPGGRTPDETLSILPPHPDTLSSLLVPITFHEEMAGVIHVHAKTKGRFDTESLEIAQALAIQASIALGNARLFQNQVMQNALLNRRIDTLARMLEANRALQSNQPLENSLQTIAFGIQESTPFRIILISIYDPVSGNLLRKSSAGLSADMMDILQANSQSWGDLTLLLQDEYRIGNVYFIPYEKMPVLPANIHYVVPLPFEERSIEDNSWHPEDLLLIPIYDGMGEPLGLISVDDPRDGKRPDLPSIESLELFASQAALTIEVHQKVKILDLEVQDLQRELNRFKESDLEAQACITALTKRVEDQSSQQDRLAQRAQRIQAGLSIAEAVTHQKNLADLRRVIGQELLEQLGLDMVLIAEPGYGGPQLLHASGCIPAGVKPDSLLGQRNPIQHCLQNGEMMIIPDVENDTVWMGSPILHALGAKGFICLPILIEKRTEIAILALSRSPLSKVTPEDEQLYQQLSRQIAITLQNINLLTKAHRNLHEVNLLLDFTRQINSLDPQHILQCLLDNSHKAVNNVQAGMVVVWNEENQVLKPIASLGYEDNQLIKKIAFPTKDSIIGLAFTRREAYRIEEIDFASHYGLASVDLLNYRDATNGKLPVSSLIVPIIITKQRSEVIESALIEGVLVLDNFIIPGAFSPEDQAVITSLCQQTALTLENVRLFQASQQRANQIRALNSVASTFTSSLNRHDLTTSLLDQLHNLITFNTGTLWLSEGARLTIEAAWGFKDSEDRFGISVEIEDSSLFLEMMKTGQPIYINDIRTDPRFPVSTDVLSLSWLGVPLFVKGKVLGVLALEKAEANYYSNEEIQLVTTFANQAAVALDNVFLYEDSLRRAQELDKRSYRLGLLHRLSTELSTTLNIQQILDISGKELFEAIHCNKVSIVLCKSEFESFFAPRYQDAHTLLVTENPSASIQLPFALPDFPLFDRLSQSLGVFVTNNFAKEEELAPLASYLNLCDTQSLLILPILSSSVLLGFILIHSKEAYGFATEEIELARTISNQVAISLENARLFTEARNFSIELEQRVDERTNQLAKEHSRSETLLRIITEMSSSLDLDQVLHQTLTILKDTVDASHITCLVGRPDETKLRHVASVGYPNPAPIGGMPSSLSKDQGLSGWIIKHRQSVLIDNVLQDPRWIQIPESGFHHRSAIGVPLMIGKELLGVMLLFHPEENHFSDDQLDLVQAAANQMAVAINNTELYNLIRDQAEDLGYLLHQQQVETSRSRAILEAISEGVLVTDSDRLITLFNESAQRILNLNSEQVLGNSLEHFKGLFGKATQTWIETIHTWSIDPASFHSGDAYTEQITLDEGRVVSVNLSPVLFRDKFLGTVSIFHDISHQVEVDRLKSEFVATVSHELRTPMTSIKGYVEILLMGATGPLSSQQQRFLEIVKDNAERLSILVNDLIDISRIEAGRANLEMQPLDLHYIADEVIDYLRKLSGDEDKPMTFSLDLPPDLPRVIGDPERIRQILVNLLSNAYMYTPEDGKITLQAFPLEDQVQINVQDNGIGIIAEEQARVFERFYRGDHPLVLSTSGTGLGLSIVQQLVKMHNGRIWLHSNGIPGEGSTFSFTLPVYLQSTLEIESEALLWQK